MSDVRTSSIRIFRQTLRNDRAVAFVFLAALIFVGAAILRLHALARTSFSLDESTALYFASYPEWRALLWDNNPPLFHFILKGWLHLVSTTEFGARLLPVIFSLGGVASLMVGGRMARRPVVGLLSAFFLAVSALSIRTAQDCRMYSLLEAATAAQICAYWWMVNRPSRRSRAAFIVSALIALGAHVFGILSVFFTSVLFVVRRRQKSLWISMGAILIGVISITAARFDFRYVMWHQLYYELGPSSLTKGWEFTEAFGQWDVLMSVLLLAACGASLFDKDREQAFFSRLTLIATVGLWIAIYLASVLTHRLIFIPRYFIFLNPFLAWNAAVGCRAVWSRGRWLQSFVAVGCVSFALFSMRAYDYDKPRWRDLAKIAVDQKADLVMTTRPKGLSVPYYSQAGIPLIQFAYGEDFIDVLKKELKTHHVIWIADDKWARAQYETELVSGLNQAGIAHRSYHFLNDYQDPVFGIAIYAGRQKR